MKIGIVTLVGNNYGNRLQNYALQEYLKSLYPQIQVETLRRNYSRNVFLANVKHSIHKLLKPDSKNILMLQKKFDDFNKTYISMSNDTLYKFKNNAHVNKDYDYFIIGSDQVWNPGYTLISPVDFGCFADKYKRISYAASIGMDELPNDKRDMFISAVKGMNYISVREQAGAKLILKETGRAVEVHIDPTMLLCPFEWEKIERKPEWYRGKPYILVYFLGNIDDKRKIAIKKKAQEYNAQVIYVYDTEQSLEYIHDPSEFVWLIHNAKCIMTDSFHCVVFSLLFGNNFSVYRRLGNETNTGSRIDTLLSYFNMSMAGKTQMDFFDYKRECIHVVLEAERKKSKNYLLEALNLL